MPRIRDAATVLIVDDEPALRRVLAQALGAGGYAVLPAGDADEAIRLLRSTPNIALLVTDVIMPRTSGPELVRAARRFRPGILVLYMSGFMDDAASEHIASQHFIQKPFTPRQFRETVDEILTTDLNVAA